MAVHRTCVLLLLHEWLEHESLSGGVEEGGGSAGGGGGGGWGYSHFRRLMPF